MNTTLNTEPYKQQLTRWPRDGRVILAQFDADSIIVYQAYRPAIGHFAAENGYFGGPFKLTRMTWIKPNFLWMMYRCGWGMKEGQEVVLAIRLQRAAFDHILSLAVHSSFTPDVYDTREAWQRLVKTSDVRLQWDPDHDPRGNTVNRRAIQLGLRGDAITKYARDWMVEIQDISSFVAEQRAHAISGDYGQLLTPTEAVYPVANKEVAAKLGLSL
ncbi:MAG: DUF4291 domain-containing protein [Spirulina sp. SIO3F2]|nr:DUF4291 domain-containing protein [Spirulina sp. SIO3F2]